MRLAHLDQRIHLHWGEAGQLADAIETVLCAVLESPEPQAVAMVLSIGLLNRVRGRLLSRQLVEQRHIGPRPRKPWKMTLRYDEVAALMQIWCRAPLAGLAWGEVQRVSLNLESVIEF